MDNVNSALSFKCWAIWSYIDIQPILPTIQWENDSIVRWRCVFASTPEYKRVYSLIIHLFFNSHSCRDQNYTKVDTLKDLISVNRDFDCFRLQLRYGRRWGTVHPDPQPSHPMNNNQLVANYSFVEGEYITSMTMQSGGRLDGFTMKTNIRTYLTLLALEAG